MCTQLIAVPITFPVVQTHRKVTLSPATVRGRDDNHGDISCGRTRIFVSHQQNLCHVIPKLPAAGGQERDLTSACTDNAVWLRRVVGACNLVVLNTSVVVHAHRKVPLSPAFSVRV